MKTWLVADFEFTVHDAGPGRPRAFFPEVIEAGAVLIKEPEYKEEPVLQTFVLPKYFPKIRQECTNITMIKQKDVEAGISFEKVLEKLAAVYEPGATGFVCWGDSDQKVLAQACARYKINCPFDWSDYIDLAAEYKAFAGSSRTIGLQQALEETQVERFGMSHLAMDDATNTARILVWLIKQGWCFGQIV